LDAALEALANAVKPYDDPTLGKLTTADRTPDDKEVAAALRGLIAATKPVETKHRKAALDLLRGHIAAARAHAKRLDQARQRTDITYDQVLDARSVRDLLDKGRGIIAKQKSIRARGPKAPLPVPSGFKRETISIRVLGGKQEVEADVMGAIAIHRNVGKGRSKGYAITHTPSGLRILSAKTQRKANEAAKELIAMFPGIERASTQKAIKALVTPKMSELRGLVDKYK
jgi:hypothetical protein